MGRDSLRNVATLLVGIYCAFRVGVVKSRNLMSPLLYRRSCLVSFVANASLHSTIGDRDYHMVMKLVIQHIDLIQRRRREDVEREGSCPNAILSVRLYSGTATRSIREDVPSPKETVT